MDLNCTTNGSGIKIANAYDSFRLIYPDNIWGAYPSSIKNVLVDNLAHLLTITMPLVAGINSVSYNTSLPFFRDHFNEIIIKSIPSAIEDYIGDTKNIIKTFKNIEYQFVDNVVKIPDYEQEVEPRVIVPLSFGKDSLTTFAVCDELGLDPVPIYINDTVSPPENKLKLDFGKKFADEFIKPVFVTNEIERLNDFEFWKKTETCLPYMHMVTGFCFITLPVMNYYRAKYVVLGNQHDMNFQYVNRDGFITHPSADQTSEWTKRMDDIMRKMTKNTGVISLISPLTNIAIIKILHNRYPEYAKYNISCDCLDKSGEKRWCHFCNKCARLFLFMKAVGVDVKKLGFRHNLLDREYRNFFSLFNGDGVDCYEKSNEAKEQQLLAFYMAMKQGAKGGLIDDFKRHFLEEAEARNDELQKKFFSIHKPENLPHDVRSSVLSIYKEELEL